jgi:hypothetical protein
MMVLSVGGIRKLSETPAELIQDYVDFLKSQPTVQGSGQPAGVGFLMTQHVPAEFGPGIETKPPEIVYTHGVLNLVGVHNLGGWGTRQLSSTGFALSGSIWVQLDQPASLNASGAAQMTLTLHHDVLVGSTTGVLESTLPGSVATVMLWAIPASIIR